MKKYVWTLVLLFGMTGLAHAEDAAAPAAATAPAEAVSAETAAAQPAAATEPAASAETAAAAPTAAVQPAPEGAAAENLEFISGEVSATDEAAKTITVKLYGETENTPGDKSVTVTVDSSTDITDGEKDRDLKSLTNGTEVDVEYDPTSNKATYIFVY